MVNTSVSVLYLSSYTYTIPIFNNYFGSIFSFEKFKKIWIMTEHCANRIYILVLCKDFNNILWILIFCDGTYLLFTSQLLENSKAKLLFLKKHKNYFIILLFRLRMSVRKLKRQNQCTNEVIINVVFRRIFTGIHCTSRKTLILKYLLFLFLVYLQVEKHINTFID